VISLAQGAMMPATNTIIAASVPQDRRGTAFGIASSVQALSFIVGPMGAALFAAISFRWGFIGLGAALAATGLAIFLGLREPNLTGRASAPTAEPKTDARPEGEPELQGSAVRA
jgi:MFS family permease